MVMHQIANGMNNVLIVKQYFQIIHKLLQYRLHAYVATFEFIHYFGSQYLNLCLIIVH